MEYNYIEIGNRIRLEREKLNLSQEKLLNNIRKKGKPCIGRNTLSKIENGDKKAFNAISLTQLTSICEEFGCSISFLFGEYNYRDYDNKFICEKTGLCENAIKKLIDQNSRPNHYFIDSLNILLLSQNFDNALSHIPQYMQAVKIVEIIGKQRRERQIEAVAHKDLETGAYNCPYNENLEINYNKNQQDMILQEYTIDKNFKYVIQELNDCAKNDNQKSPNTKQ